MMLESWPNWDISEMYFLLTKPGQKFTTVEEVMAYENHVYLAKLAEQAERYEGER